MSITFWIGDENSREQGVVEINMSNSNAFAVCTGIFARMNREMDYAGALSHEQTFRFAYEALNQSTRYVASGGQEAAYVEHKSRELMRLALQASEHEDWRLCWG